jgi:YD repeat-containing protein
MLKQSTVTSLSISLIAILACLAHPLNAFAGDTYVYDPAGRLKAVVDSLGRSAVYNYDLAGNLRSITNGDSSHTAVYTIAPNNGPVGTSVTIYGDGFSTTPSQNTVVFSSGKTATVTASTQTTITTTVPGGTIIGVVTVTSPAGAASTNFTVGP